VEAERTEPKRAKATRINLAAIVVFLFKMKKRDGNCGAATCKNEDKRGLVRLIHAVG
jgi:hypothetical protein